MIIAIYIYMMHDVKHVTWWMFTYIHIYIYIVIYVRVYSKLFLWHGWKPRAMFFGLGGRLRQRSQRSQRSLGTAQRNGTVPISAGPGDERTGLTVGWIWMDSWYGAVHLWLEMWGSCWFKGNNGVETMAWIVWSKCSFQPTMSIDVELSGATAHNGPRIHHCSWGPLVVSFYSW